MERLDEMTGAERQEEFNKENLKLANEFAKEGSVQHFAFRLGYMPYDEKQAEAILTSVIKEGEEWQRKYEMLKEYGIG